MDDSVVEKYHLDDTTINLFAEKYDVILPEIKDIRKMPSMGNNMREQYLGSGYLHECDYNTMMTVLNEKYPEFAKYALEYENGHTTYLNNMFIMKREIFNAYSAWLFDILEECDKRIDYSDYSIEAIRTLGHLAERLLNIYCLYLKSQNIYKFKELQTVAFLNTEVEREITPAYPVNNVAIALSANDFYVPYVSALLISLRENCSLNNNYDIIIMHRDISPDSQRKLSSVFNTYNNVTVRFLNINKYTSKFKNLYLRGHFAVETYFRLLMPEILPNYEKILYLDSDIIVNADVADLYNENIEDYLLAACHDADTAGLYNGYEPNKKDYMDHILKIKKPYEYFQAGVILFNLNEFRKTYTVEEMLQYDDDIMDNDKRFVTGLDVGTENVRAVIASVGKNGEVAIVGYNEGNYAVEVGGTGAHTDVRQRRPDGRGVDAGCRGGTGEGAVLGHGQAGDLCHQRVRDVVHSAAVPHIAQFKHAFRELG